MSWNLTIQSEEELKPLVSERVRVRVVVLCVCIKYTPRPAVKVIGTQLNSMYSAPVLLCYVRFNNSETCVKCVNLPRPTKTLICC